MRTVGLFVGYDELDTLGDSDYRTLTPPRLLHPTALREALDDVSQDHVIQAETEWVWLYGVRERLRRRPLVFWSRAEVVNLLKHAWRGRWVSDNSNDARPPAERPGQLVNYLIELGVFRTRWDDRIDVPDLYLYGLELRRKGGVSRRRSATPTE